MLLLLPLMLYASYWDTLTDCRIVGVAWSLCSVAVWLYLLCLCVDAFAVLSVTHCVSVFCLRVCPFVRLSVCLSVCVSLFLCVLVLRPLVARTAAGVHAGNHAPR